MAFPPRSESSFAGSGVEAGEPIPFDHDREINVVRWPRQGVEADCPAAHHGIRHVKPIEEIRELVEQ